MTGGPQFEPDRTSPTSPPRAQPGRGRRLVLLLAAAILLVSSIAVIAVLTVLRNGDGGERAGGPTVGAVSGDYDQWVATMCTQRSLMHSSAPHFIGALDDASCAARGTPAGDPPVALRILVWPPSVDVAGRMARFPAAQVYAVAAVGGTSTVFTASRSADRSVLEPLTAFGFVIVGSP